MRNYLSLLKLYIASLYDIRALGDMFRAGPKGIAKGVGIVVLAVYIIGALAIIPLISSIQTYQTLKPLGLQSLVVLNGAITATAFTLILGFITCFTTYFMTGAETYLLALPLKPRSLLGAKLSLVYISECALAFLLLAASLGVYAWFERPGPLYYLYALLLVLTTPFVPIALSYFILVPLLGLVRFLRRKDVIFLVAGVLSLSLTIGWQINYQQQMIKAQDPAWLIANLKNPDSIMVRFAAAYPPARWAAGALSSDALSGGALSGGAASAASFIDLLRYLGLQLGVMALALLVLAKPYVRSLASYDEALVKRLKDSGAYIATGFRRSGQFVSCLRREIAVMLNEPVYLFNGPFVVLLMPVIFSAMYLAMKDEFIKDLPFLTDPSALPVMTLAAACFSAFMGGMTSVACTSLSREGGQFFFVKSLPLRVRPYWGAKYAHGLLYVVFAAIIGPLLISRISPLGWERCLVASFAGFGLAALLNLLGLILDTANPRLRWSSPTAAMKQNPNAVVGAISGMAIVGGIGYLGSLNLENGWFLPLVGAIGLSASAIIFQTMLPWVGRRLAAIE